MREAEEKAGKVASYSWKAHLFRWQEAGNARLRALGCVLKAVGSH